ncbi:LysR family transcriptional regulator [Bordetella genomosp. 10]|uniref:LysR family transcriptional regulator n=1 Tax=Bordetella genomosp. 10 TaxID=1416804 RepID=A0A261S349_9BORD|nr:transcriptional regulator GcvA [Bordetella genomosp. 10]OZI31220.1 LysR family transcriptional regulator [Bordetella genomosp. 10]
MPRPIPPLNPLRAFEVAARHLSFTRAAEELCVTPSAVSHQIKVLEDNLGVPLFVRDSKSLILTSAGKAYLPGVQEAFRQLVQATYRVQRERQMQALKLNLPPTFAVKWLIPRMKRFKARHPEIDLRVSTTKNMSDFERDDVDVEVRYGRGDYPGLHAERCLAVEVTPVCSPALLDGAAPLARADDLRHHTLLHDDSTYDDVSNPDWATWMAHAGVSGVDTSRGPSFWPSHLVIDAAIDGLGVALAKRNWVRRDIAAGRLVEPFPDLALRIEFSYFLVYPEERESDPRIQAFAAWVREELARDGDGEDAWQDSPGKQKP